MNSQEQRDLSDFLHNLLDWLWGLLGRLMRNPPPCSGRSASDAPIPERGPTSQDWVLVLVINVRHETVLRALEAGATGDLAEDELYNAVQSRWFGSSREYCGLRLTGWFSRTANPANETEYDVRMARFDLDHDDPGFHRGASELEQVDAFRRLAASSAAVGLSPRLPPEAYGTTEVYI